MHNSPSFPLTSPMISNYSHDLSYIFPTFLTLILTFQWFLTTHMLYLTYSLLSLTLLTHSLHITCLFLHSTYQFLHFLTDSLHISYFTSDESYFSYILTMMWYILCKSNISFKLKRTLISNKIRKKTKVDTSILSIPIYKVEGTNPPQLFS